MYLHRYLYRVAFACLLLVGLCVHACPAWSAAFVGLGDFAGGDDSSHARGLSNDGNTVVGTGRVPGNNRGFVWTAGSPGGGAGLAALPALTSTPSSLDNSSAWAVSGDGTHAVGTTNRTNGSVAGGMWALPGIAAVPPTYVGEVGDLPGSLEFSTALGTSDDGSVTAGWSFSSGPGGVPPSAQQAFVWTQADGISGLGDLTGGNFFSQAFGVSGDGSTVVGWSSSTGGNEAFRWTQAGAIQGLGDFSGGSFQSRASAASTDGSVIVGFGNSDVGQQAFRWTSAGGMQTLSGAPQGVTPKSASAVSGDGATIVGSLGNNGATEAMVWTAADGPRSIQQLLQDAGLGAALAGWTLESAIGVSDDGLTFAGNGTNPAGDSEGWWATLAGVTILAGDYNDSGQVEQGDLDLVLQNWGSDTGINGVPAAWLNDLPSGQIEQTELDGVLQNWGNTAAPEFGGSDVPEPAALAVLGLLFVGWRERCSTRSGASALRPKRCHFRRH